MTPRGQFPGPTTQSPAGLDEAYVVHIDSVRLDPEVPFSRVQPKEGWGDERLRRAALGCCGEGEWMFQMVTTIVKWASIPVLLIASLFACCTASYEPLVDRAIGLGVTVYSACDLVPGILLGRRIPGDRGSLHSALPHG